MPRAKPNDQVEATAMSARVLLVLFVSCLGDGYCRGSARSFVNHFLGILSSMYCGVSTSQSETVRTLIKLVFSVVFRAFSSCPEKKGIQSVTTISVKSHTLLPGSLKRIASPSSLSTYEELCLSKFSNASIPFSFALCIV